MQQEQIATKYPRLLKALSAKYLLCTSEAICTISCYQQGIIYGCEAVSWCGRTNLEAIKGAIAYRKYSRDR